MVSQMESKGIIQQSNDARLEGRLDLNAAFTVVLRWNHRLHLLYLLNNELAWRELPRVCVVITCAVEEI